MNQYAMAKFTIEEVFNFWPQMEEQLDRVPHTWKYWTKEYIYTAIATGQLQVWGIGPPGTCILTIITSVHTYPAMQVLSVDWVAGKYEDDMAPLLYTTLEQYARMQGCTMIEVRGRPGWSPSLSKFGFNRDAFVWTRALPDVRTLQ